MYNKQRILRYYEADFWLKLWKRSEEYGFLKACHAQVLEQKLMDLDKAYKHGFEKSQPEKRLPKRKKKGMSDSFRYNPGFKVEGNTVFLPKLGWFKFRQSCEVIGKAKNMTVSYYAGHWYISIQAEQEVAQPSHQSKTMIGIDLARLVTLSNGNHFQAKSCLKHCQRKLAIAQRSLSRKQKYSNNWQAQKQGRQKIHAQIAWARNDYLHWCTHHLSKNHAMIVLEELKVANMSKSAKDRVDEPGKNVGTKSGLSRSIPDQGWGEFKPQLEYKCRWLGGELLLVPPQYTSQTCPIESCDHVAKANRRSQSEFVCVACGHSEQADVVGAKNVLRAGHAQLACGDIAAH